MTHMGCDTPYPLKPGLYEIMNLLICIVARRFSYRLSDNLIKLH